MCECCNPYAELDAIIRKHRDEPGGLMPVMQEAQNLFGALTIDVQQRIADGMNTTLSVYTAWRLFMPSSRWRRRAST